MKRAPITGAEAEVPDTEFRTPPWRGGQQMGGVEQIRGKQTGAGEGGRGQKISIKDRKMIYKK